ncbi:type II secretion system protein [Synechocystis sp. LKSZ1]|uniref:PulJ/GspJ family protein n=1 Tax=Synechocystis sp. LKSZ1 TaxID=3144951 RepID=UPI00336BBE55
MITLKSKLNPKLAWSVYRLVQPQPQAKGLTMLEVLVAMLIAFAFLTATLNAMVISAAMQVKAERQAQATYWIQKDLENIQAKAGTQASDSTKCTSSFSTSYAGSLNTSTGIPAVKYTSTDASPTYTTGTNSLVATVVASSILGRAYTMTRTTGGSDTNPQILTVNYTVRNANDPTTLASLYTEVIPPKALAC